MTFWLENPSRVLEVQRTLAGMLTSGKSKLRDAALGQSCSRLLDPLDALGFRQPVLRG